MTFEKLTNELRTSIKNGDDTRKSTLSSVIARATMLARSQGHTSNVPEDIIEKAFLQLQKETQGAISACPNTNTTLSKKYIAQLNILREYVIQPTHLCDEKKRPAFSIYPPTPKTSKPITAHPKKNEIDLDFVTCNHLFLSNKETFLNEHLCPRCSCKTRHRNIRLECMHKHQIGGYYRSQEFHFFSWITSKPLYCSSCNSYYISPEALAKLNEHIYQKTNSIDSVVPSNIEIYRENGTPLYIPYASLNEDEEYVAAGINTLYTMSVEELNYAQQLPSYKDDIFEEDVFEEIPLRSQSFLGKHGYTVNKDAEVRHHILKYCSSQYGKWKVLQQLRFNIQMREQQKESNKYARAIFIWNKDIEFVESLIESDTES